MSTWSKVAYGKSSHCFPRPSPPVPDKKIMHSAALDWHNVHVSLQAHCNHSVGTAGRKGIDIPTFRFCLVLCLHDAILRCTIYGSCPDREGEKEGKSSLFHCLTIRVYSDLSSNHATGRTFSHAKRV
ncbi:hypothetical protein BO79DRAFT_231950 [Aspergillus costaricaensis CBS 115574]|uniref:Uncharacterized protein n=1 Tax=Aspergillus costaricaensis CBS 115574 TaxID=1448317 RepID=A0ACD1I412_9EURO|nr:hypothetical protein BO79DRAFT_231950 [Aspergillus costaricaensis CBS 115574]RAK85028.1 hypothetical protein BO79DRAFT_231950 [Aspergillus costaricaensis CBS 115574]